MSEIITKYNRNTKLCDLSEPFLLRASDIKEFLSAFKKVEANV